MGCPSNGQLQMSLRSILIYLFGLKKVPKIEGPPTPSGRNFGAVTVSWSSRFSDWSCYLLPVTRKLVVSFPYVSELVTIWPYWRMSYRRRSYRRGSFRPFDISRPSICIPSFYRHQAHYPQPKYPEPAFKTPSDLT